MKTWLVWGSNLPRLEIVSNSMDKALEKARQIDDKYNTCQLKDIKLRTANTPLTEEEKAYCYNDVRWLCECIESYYLEDNITTLYKCALERRKSMKTLMLTFIDDETIIIRNIKNIFYACEYLNIYYNDGTFERYKLENIDNFNIL